MNGEEKLVPQCGRREYRWREWRRSGMRLRVIVTVMHEHEAVAVRYGAGDLHQIGSMFVGEMTESDVERLRKQNVLVDVYGAARRAWPCDYAVTCDLHTAILLQHNPISGVTLEGRTENGRDYIVRVRDVASLAELCKRNGVTGLVRMQPPRFADSDAVTTWTILLTDGVTSDAVQKKITSLGAEIVKADGRAIRARFSHAQANIIAGFQPVHRVEEYVEPTLNSAG